MPTIFVQWKQGGLFLSLLLTFLFLFFMGSLIGWCIELIFRRFFSRANPQRKWINPGFLVGPYLPLYGFGLCILYLLSSISLPEHLPLIWHILLKLVLMALGMTVIEYIAGLIFIKRMNVKLWDYSDQWGNIQGIICPRFSFFWLVLSAVYYFTIHPYILSALDWLSRNLVFSFVIGFFYGVFFIDVCYSLNVLAKIRAFARKNEIIVYYEQLKAHIDTLRAQQKKKRRFVFALRSEEPLSELLQGYRQKYARFVSDRRQKKTK